MTTETQCLRLQRYLSQGHSLTPLSALKRFGVMALSQRMGDLRRARWPVESEFVDVGGKRVKRYWFQRGRRK